MIFYVFTVPNYSGENNDSSFSMHFPNFPLLFFPGHVKCHIPTFDDTIVIEIRF